MPMLRQKRPRDPQCFVAYLWQRMGPIRQGEMPPAPAEIDAVEFVLAWAVVVNALVERYYWEYCHCLDMPIVNQKRRAQEFERATLAILVG
jgi:hypothetical protein